MKFRLLKIKDQLKKKRLDATLVSSLSNITYLTVLSGFSKDEREALLLITANQQYILTDKRYAEEIQDVIPAPSRGGSAFGGKAGIQNDNYIDSHFHRNDKGKCSNRFTTFQLEEVSSSIPFRKALEKLFKKHKIKKLGIEVDDLKVSEYTTLKKIFRAESALISFQISENRTIKEQTELDAIEKACVLTDQTFAYILTKIKPGVTEKELAFEIEMFIKKHNGDLAFPPIVAFGKNSAVSHHKPTDSVIPNLIGNPENSNIILLDFGAKVNNYCSDMTRVVFLGKASDEQKKIYETVLEAQKRTIEYFDKVAPLTRCDLQAKDVDKITHDYIREQGFGQNIFHSLGHGVGLEIHESPRLSSKSKEILKPGMVFTIEPGIYLPAGRQGLPERFGIRIEDTVVLEKNRLRILTKSPRNFIEL